MAGTKLEIYIIRINIGDNAKIKRKVDINLNQERYVHKVGGFKVNKTDQEGKHILFYVIILFMQEQHDVAYQRLKHVVNNPYLFSPPTASQAIIHYRLTARARPQ